MKEAKIGVFIPARYGSTRFEGKPLSLISEKPLIQRVYEQAEKADCISEVIVATDDKRIADCVENFAGKYIFTSQKHRSGTDRIAEAAKAAGFGMDDIIVNVQGDQPILNPICISEVAAPFFEDESVEMSTLVCKMTDMNEYKNSNTVKAVLDNKGFALYFSRSPIPYAMEKQNNFNIYKHLGVYAYKRSFLEKFTQLPLGQLENIEKLEQLRALENGFKIKAVVTKYNSFSIDIPEDIEKVEKLLS
jgi:3-deoxy-manno-octulosonate cytidylyltransferase (CMP-KDO synthetase)